MRRVVEARRTHQQQQLAPQPQPQEPLTALPPSQITVTSPADSRPKSSAVSSKRRKSSNADTLGKPNRQSQWLDFRNSISKRIGMRGTILFNDSISEQEHRRNSDIPEGEENVADQQQRTPNKLRKQKSRNVYSYNSRFSAVSTEPQAYDRGHSIDTSEQQEKDPVSRRAPQNSDMDDEDDGKRLNTQPSWWKALLCCSAN